MNARVSTIKVAPEQIDGSIRYFEEVVVPDASELTGFKGATLLVHREKGMTRSITYWDSRDDLDGSAEAATRLRTGLKDRADTAELISVEVYEVAVDVTAG
jgi:heme-degrading monooxygenase HmoA